MFLKHIRIQFKKFNLRNTFMHLIIINIYLFDVNLTSEWNIK